MTAARIVVIGGGGHAKVVIDAIRLAGLQPEAVLDADSALHGRRVLDVPVAGGDEAARDFPPDRFQLVMGVGGATKPTTRIGLFRRFEAQGYTFRTVVHPTAVIASDVEIGAGAQVMAGAVVQPGTRIGAGALINTRAAVDHDCRIGAHAHVGPGAVLCGDVRVGDAALIGAGAAVRPGVAIGAEAIVGAGAAVIGDVAARARVGGVPAKPLGEASR